MIKEGKKTQESKYTIEIVDDHLQTVVGLCNTLEFNGFRCLQAYNAKDAINLANKENPDLLIVDVIMNDGGGYDVARALPNKKVILISAYEKDEKEIAKIKNIAGFMQKPIGAFELLQFVKKVLGISNKSYQ
jgi:DNA-binding response OmpR family regulator